MTGCQTRRRDQWADLAIRHGESAFMLRSDGGADERALRREVAPANNP